MWNGDSDRAYELSIGLSQYQEMYKLDNRHVCEYDCAMGKENF